VAATVVMTMAVWTVANGVAAEGGKKGGSGKGTGQAPHTGVAAEGGGKGGGAGGPKSAEGGPAAERANAAQALLVVFDVDGNGVISFAEFETVNAMIRKLDANRDGLITPEEAAPFAAMRRGMRGGAGPGRGGAGAGAGERPAAGGRGERGGASKR
jgi:hypothetical protein